MTVRDYAAGKLDAAGETATTRDQHARYYRQLVGSAGISSDRPGPQRFELVNPELANVRAAIGWATESGDAELAGELIVALEGAWIPNRPTEGLRHLDAIRADDERLPIELRARLLRVKGGCLYFQGDLEGGENATVAASDLHRKLGDDLGVAILQHRLGVLAVVRGEHQKARRMILESLEACRALGFRKGEAAAHEALGLIARAEGDLDTAATLLAQSAALSAAERLPWMEAGALESLAELELDRARPREAGEFAQRALRLNVAIESRAGILHSLGYLAAALVRSGNPTRATVLWHAIEADEAVNGRTFSEEDRESLAVDGVAFESRARVGDPEHEKPWALARAIEEALAMDFEDPSG